MKILASNRRPPCLELQLIEAGYRATVVQADVTRSPAALEDPVVVPAGGTADGQGPGGREEVGPAEAEEDRRAARAIPMHASGHLQVMHGQGRGGDLLGVGGVPLAAPRRDAKDVAGVGLDRRVPLLHPRRDDVPEGELPVPLQAPLDDDGGQAARGVAPAQAHEGVRRSHHLEIRGHGQLVGGQGRPLVRVGHGIGGQIGGRTGRHQDQQRGKAQTNHQDRGPASRRKCQETSMVRHSHPPSRDPIEAKPRDAATLRTRGRPAPAPAPARARAPTRRRRSDHPPACR